MFLPMGMLGGCAAVALMWWAQAPLLAGLERAPADQPQAGQLIHPLYLQIDAPAPPPSRTDDGARWTLEHVSVKLDGAPLVEAAAPAAEGDQPVWEGEVTPGAHTLLSLFVFRREGASEDDPAARVEIERPQIFQARPGRPLALTLAQ